MAKRPKAPFLKFRQNLSPETIAKMRELRQDVFNLQSKIDELGESRELSLVFTNLQQALFFINAHLCYVDTGATLETLPQEEGKVDLEAAEQPPVDVI